MDLGKFNFLWRKPSPQEMMARELTEAKHGLLEAQTGRDYAESMVAYHTARIDRLREMLEQETRDGGF